MPTDTSDDLRILFVCTANNSRSPYLELTARARAGEEAGLTFASAGVYARNDTHIDPGMAVELTARGIASEDFRSRRLTSSLVDEADLVLDGRGRAPGRDPRRAPDRDPQGADRRAGRPRARPDRPRGRPGRSATALVAAPRRRDSPDRDIVDPYRQGPEAAPACAQILDRIVDRLLARMTADASGPAR